MKKNRGGDQRSHSISLKKKVHLGGGVNGGARGGQGEGEVRLGENNIMGDQGAISGEVEALIPPVIR